MRLRGWAFVRASMKRQANNTVAARVKATALAKTVLIQAAHAAGHTQTYLGEQYRRISARRGSKKAAMAVGHSILVIFYHMVKSGEPYREKGVDYLTTSNKEQMQQRLVRQLERLGNTVILQPKAETTLA